MDFQKEIESISELGEELQRDIGGFLDEKKETLTVEEIDVLIKKFEFYIQKFNQKAKDLASGLNLSKDQIDELSTNPENLNIKELEPLIDLKKKIEEFQKNLTKGMLTYQDKLLLKKELEDKQKHKLKSSRKNWIPS